MPRQSRDDVIVRLRDALDALAPVIGDRLPAERVLAGQLDCSRATLRAALDALEAEGLVWRHVGQGTFRGRRLTAGPVRASGLGQEVSPGDLMDARLHLEPQVAAAAARRADAADLKRLVTYVDQGRRARDRAACELADSLFHRAVADATHNPVFGGLLQFLSDTRRRAAWQRTWDQTYRIVGVAEFTALHSDQHAAVVAAIAARDPDAAGLAMRQHLETIAQAMARPVV